VNNPKSNENRITLIVLLAFFFTAHPFSSPQRALN
jgi:hypothetical protein